jgi:hypothetical protein
VTALARQRPTFAYRLRYLIERTTTLDGLMLRIAADPRARPADATDGLALIADEL